MSFKLTQLTLLNYRNQEEARFDTNAAICCFVGANGRGKTNVLDAIYHLAFTKGYLNPISLQNIRHGEQFFLIEGVFDRENGEEHIVCSLQKGQKKVVKRNGKIYDRHADHVGLIPLVMISPTDQDLIAEGSETRRRFMDAILSQLDPLYLDALLTYQKLLVQRNALLRYFSLNRTFDALNLGIYTDQMQAPAQYIHQKRTDFLAQFLPLFHHYHQALTAENDQVDLVYESTMNSQDWQSMQAESLARDRQLNYTASGIHKDDIKLSLDGFPMKRLGSQGQQKSLLIALKLAQFDLMKKESGAQPILLLDDVFDKLDETRVNTLVSLVRKGHFGQIFLSDTHPERTEQLVRGTELDFKIFPL